MSRESLYGEYLALASRTVTTDRIDSAKALIDHLYTKTDFFMAPAASRVRYHDCYSEGLAKHTLNVIRLMHAQIEMLFEKDSPRYLPLYWNHEPTVSPVLLKESAFFIGVIHDANKCSDLNGDPWYIENMLKTGRSEAEPWKHNPGRIPTGNASQMALAFMYTNPKSYELQAIEYVEGMYNGGYRSEVSGKEEPMTNIAHHADMVAAYIVGRPEVWTPDHRMMKASRAVAKGVTPQ